METTQPTRVQPLGQAVRLLLIVFAVFTMLGFIDLFVGSEHTASRFAWTIKPPLTAAFLGCNYLAGFVLVVLSFREKAWATARLGFVTVLVFVLMTLLATLMHLGNFHLDSPDFGPWFVAWVWMVIYFGIPVAMIVGLVLQHRIEGEDPPTTVRPSQGLRIALGVEGVLLLATGVLLFVAPGSVDPWWPWLVTPLTARAIGSWLIAFGFGAGLTFYENDLSRIRIPGISYALVGLLQLMNLVLYSDQVQWEEASALIYVAFAVILIGTGCFGVLAERRGRIARQIHYARSVQSS